MTHKTKNIHLLPTDKSGRVGRFVDTQELILRSGKDIPRGENVNIYITSDEEIRDVRPHKGKWHLEGGNILNKFPNYLTDLSECKLIILTTDPDLIKDGVQAIDDEFLEWFVKSPSRENVKVELIEEIPSGFTFGMFGNDEPPTELVYKIIIPKEEPKQETIEEAAERLFPFTKDDSENRIITIKRLFWIEGAKWQAERMHSEEELKSAFKIGFNIGYGSPVQELDLKNEHCEKWFEQFKKK
jgi:hypothetical protein